jgi:hypothetical protein
VSPFSVSSGDFLILLIRIILVVNKNIALILRHFDRGKGFRSPVSVLVPCPVYDAGNCVLPLIPGSSSTERTMIMVSG